MTTSKLYVDPDYVARAAKDDFAKYAKSRSILPFGAYLIDICSAFARIENHYFVNDVCLCAVPYAIPGS